MKYILLVSAVLLGGCAHSLPTATAPKQHHVARPLPKPVAKPVATVAPAPAAPSPQQTFRRRWLRLFFRDRAVAK